MMLFTNGRLAATPADIHAFGNVYDEVQCGRLREACGLFYFIEETQNPFIRTI